MPRPAAPAADTTLEVATDLEVGAHGLINGALAHLLQHGFVAPWGEPAALPPPSAPGFSAQDAVKPVRAATSLEHYERVRAEASAFIRQRLGDAATPICTAVDRCASPQELRRVLRGVEVFVGQRLDAQTAQAFARHFGAMLL